MELETVIGLLEASSDDSASQPEAQVAAWSQLVDDEGAAEQQRLQEEGRLLRRAWKEIENEQRRLLGMRESLNADRAMPSETVCKAIPAVTDVPDVEQMALSQFQELRRQIQSHARRGEST